MVRGCKTYRNNRRNNGHRIECIFIADEFFELRKFHGPILIMDDIIVSEP